MKRNNPEFGVSCLSLIQFIGVKQNIPLNKIGNISTKPLLPLRNINPSIMTLR